MLTLLAQSLGKYMTLDHSSASIGPTQPTLKLTL